MVRLRLRLHRCQHRSRKVCRQCTDYAIPCINYAIGQHHSGVLSPLTTDHRHQRQLYLLILAIATLFIFYLVTWLLSAKLVCSVLNVLEYKLHQSGGRTATDFFGIHQRWVWPEGNGAARACASSPSPSLCLGPGTPSPALMSSQLKSVELNPNLHFDNFVDNFHIRLILVSLVTRCWPGFQYCHMSLLSAMSSNQNSSKSVLMLHSNRLLILHLFYHFFNFIRKIFLNFFD